MTLRNRLVAALGLVVVVLVAVGWWLPREVRAAQIDQVDEQLRGAAPVAARLSDRFQFPTPPGRAAQGSPPPGAPTRFSELYVARINGDARTVLLAPASTKGRVPTRPASSTRPGRRPVPVTVGSRRGSGSWRALLVALPDGSFGLVALPLDHVDATVHRVQVAVLIAGGAVLLALAAAGWWLSRLGLRPIAEVTSVAGAIANGERDRRVSEAASGTEAAQLARAFNRMLDERDASEAQLRRFVADASHELRTPVTAIGGFADLWRQGAVDDAELAEMMHRIGQQSSRMRALVEDLLLLAHLDEGTPLARGPVDLTQLAHDAVDDAASTHPSRQVDVGATEPVIVRGDATRLRRVIANLVTNALVHTEPTTVVEIRCERAQGHAELRVRDDGPGMVPEDAARAFDRFWRADAARPRTGSGLGLAIVRGIVTEHGGTTVLESAPDTGTTVTVTLPLDHAAGLADEPEAAGPAATGSATTTARRAPAGRVT
jgi:two-component system, OmpR family, sensor kinase